MASKKKALKDAEAPVTVITTEIPAPPAETEPVILETEPVILESPEVVDDTGVPIKQFPVGKIFGYQGKKWQKASILQPGNISRCQLTVERDGGLYVDPSVRIDLSPDTKIIP